jgi:SAM-dependent methyltransferase/ribosomal protein S27E
MASDVLPGGPALELVRCPNCGSTESAAWAIERGFHAVRCARCALIFVNPRPGREYIQAAVVGGAHGHADGRMDVSARRMGSKVGRYRRVLGRLFSDLWSAEAPVSWLDVGAGYGELVEAVMGLAPKGSIIEGLEPMKPKADDAKRRGLPVSQEWLSPGRPKVDVVSLVDVFSHIPDFNEILADVRSVLRPGGHLFLETGNLADLETRDQFPNELGLPDHLVFAGEEQIRGFLERARFQIVQIERARFDGVVNFFKCIAKKAIGRPVAIQIPYRSKYRQLLIRARAVS